MDFNKGILHYRHTRNNITLTLTNEHGRVLGWLTSRSLREFSKRPTLTALRSTITLMGKKIYRKKLNKILIYIQNPEQPQYGLLYNLKKLRTKVYGISVRKKRPA